MGRSASIYCPRKSGTEGRETTGETGNSLYGLYLPALLRKALQAGGLYGLDGQIINFSNNRFKWETAPMMSMMHDPHDAQNLI